MGVIRTIGIKISGLAATLLLVGVSIAPIVAAGPYDVAVNASVNFPAPTTAAVIDPSLDNTTVANAYFHIYGTCQVGTPYYVISIVKSGATIGSTDCQSNGTFSLNISLTSGINNLIARSASVSHLYGPDSQPVNITLELPPAPPVTETPTISSPQDTSSNNGNDNSPDTSTKLDNTSVTTITNEQNAAINEGARENLFINTSEPFSVMNNDNGTAIEVNIGGGRAPYTVTINWGDGSVESKVVDLPSKYTYSHTYKEARTYHVTGEVRDVLGAVTRFEYLTSTGKADPHNRLPGANNVASFQPGDSINYLAVIMFSSFAIVGITSFLLGRAIEVEKIAKVKPKKRKP